MNDIAKPVHRLLGLVLFAGAPAVLLTLAGLNLIDMAESRTRSAQDGALLARLAGRIAQDGNSAAGEDISPIYVPGSTLSLASANLRQRIVELVAAGNGRLIETRAADAPPSDRAADAGAVRLAATFDCDNDGLATILRDLESGLPLLQIETLAIRRVAADAAGDDDNPRLRVEMLAKGYVSAPVPGAAP